MRRSATLATLLVLLLGLAVTPPPARSATPDRYIVVLRPNTDAPTVAQEHAGTYELTVDHLYEHALKGYAAAIPVGLLAHLKADRRVQSVMPDTEVHADGSGLQPVTTKKPGSPTPTLAPQPKQVASTGLRRIGGSGDGVHQTLPNKGAGVGVAVLDSGIDLHHPDLAGAVSGTSCIKGTRTADDDYGHGTHVAGTIAARDNAIGVVGVAPAATLYAVKVLDATGSGSLASLICGIDWVTANAARIGVANLSLSVGGAAMPSNADCSNGNDDALHTAICRSVRAGVTYIVAAGNGRADATGVVPAAYEEVVAVSALADSDGAPGGAGVPACTGTADDTFASFSNYGAAVDLAAPGACIRSTARGGGYESRTGTSMAAPHVAGAAALYLAAHPGATPRQLRAGLIAMQEPGPIVGDPDSYKEGIVHLR